MVGSHLKVVVDVVWVTVDEIDRHVSWLVDKLLPQNSIKVLLLLLPLQSTAEVGARMRQRSISDPDVLSA